MSTLVRQRALQTWVPSICIIAVLLSLNFFTLKQCILFLHSLLKFYSKQKFVWFCYLVVFISTLLFCKNLFYLVLLLWDCDKDVTSGQVGAHAAFWEVKAGPNRAAIDSSEKRIMLDYQLTVLLVKVVSTTFFENSEPVWAVHVRIHVAPHGMLPIH